NATQQEDTIRQAAIHSISVWRDQSAVAVLWALLPRSSPQLPRAAAAALGRVGDKRVVSELLGWASAAQNDRVLEHSLIYALIEIADPIGTGAGLQANNSETKRAALIALDQMDGVGINAELVTPLLASADPVLKQTASWIVAHHPEWGGALVGF